ncbi:hypothetical protein PS2_023417 [Malus domestica]
MRGPGGGEVGIEPEDGRLGAEVEEGDVALAIADGEEDVGAGRLGGEEVAVERERGPADGGDERRERR